MADLTGPPAPLERAGIIAVGSELLTPLKSDTNSLRITDALNQLGIEVVAKAIAGDDRRELAAVVRSMLDRVDLLVLCGGLGPTDDDVTREVVAEVLDRPLAEDGDVAAAVAKRFADRGLEMPRINLRQALVPAGAVVLPNPKGTAPGLWLDLGDRAVVLLPGPPRELIPMLQRVAEEHLAARTGGRTLVRRIVGITGRTESHTDEALGPLYARWASADVRISATILAALGQIELHLSARGPDAGALNGALDRAASDVQAVLGADVFSVDGRGLEAVVGDLLVGRGWWIAVAESCTGGLVAERLTRVPGSSRYLGHGIVAYSNAAKTALLGVPPALIESKGAVSEDVARAMALGVRERSGAEVGVGVTGIAGPGGGTTAKPVGTVAVAVVAGPILRVRTLRLMGEREHVRYQASQAALDVVRRVLQG